MTVQEATVPATPVIRKSSWRKRRVAALRLAVVPVCVLAALTTSAWPDGSLVSGALELGGYLCLLLGLIIRIWATLYIGGRKSHELVTEGPYSMCRNPLYCGTFFIAMGCGLCFGSFILAAAMMLILLPAHLAVTIQEERHLLELFPQSYSLYIRDVPRFWPRIKQYRSREWLTVSSHAARRLCWNTALVLLLPPIEDLIDLLHQHHVIPMLFKLR
jgi:protein-S-isoprenylcysteine O-methyltransferase Ste14